MKYYIGVAIRKSGHAAVTKPYGDLEECLAELREYTSKHISDMLSTTYMVREGENLTLQNVFGKPKSRDLMRNKKWLNSL